MSQNEYVSYATKYDLYKGSIDIGDLSDEHQDELIQLTFIADGDARSFVMQHNIKKSQAEGLWSVVVMLGMGLERKRQIIDFENRTDDDIQLIIEQLSEFALWQRLEEAYPPFDFLENKSPYEWSELERIGPFFEKYAGASLFEIQTALFSVLGSRDVNHEYDTRISYGCCKGWLEENKIQLHQDKAQANLAAMAGIVKTNSSIFFFSGLALLIAAPIVWYTISFFIAILIVGAALFAFKTANSSLRSAVYRAAMTSKEKYRWLMSRKILWVTYND